jgi:putative ABC transport system permease protein
LKLYLTFRMAARALFRNKLRTLLTMLGIIIGVAAVISMLAIGTGARESVAASIASLGTNTLIIMPGSQSVGGARSGAFGKTTLVPADITAIAAECGAISAVTPLTQNQAQIVYQNQNWYTSVTGSNTDFPDVRNWTVSQGRFFLDDEIRSSAKVCVIGQVIADNLFPGEDVLDKVIRVRNVPMKVIGLLAVKGDTAFGQSQDDIIVVPYTTAMRRLFHLSNLRSALASATTADDVELAKAQITDLLRQRHKIEPDDDDDFTIRTQAEFAQAADAATAASTMLLAGIASVSLLVGGIGIMNIMLVSVTERVREIGIRMALGARRVDIMWQFLVESVVLSLAGGAIGVLTGYGVAHIAAHYAGWPAVVSMLSIVLALGFSICTGIFFGLYPAVRASRLDPIQALRNE